MSTIPGSTLTDAWSSINETARSTTQADLHSYLNDLRTVPSPTPAYIGSCVGASTHDHQLNNGFTCRPFALVSNFHDYLVAPVAAYTQIYPTIDPPETSTEWRC